MIQQSFIEMEIKRFTPETGYKNDANSYFFSFFVSRQITCFLAEMTKGLAEDCNNKQLASNKFIDIT